MRITAKSAAKERECTDCALLWKRIGDFAFRFGQLGQSPAVQKVEVIAGKLVP